MITQWIPQQMTQHSAWWNLKKSLKTKLEEWFIDSVAGADQVINEFLKSTEHVILPFFSLTVMPFVTRASFQRNGPSLLLFHYTRKEIVITPIIIEESLCWAHSARSLPPSKMLDLQSGQKKTLYSQKLKQASGKVIRQQTTYLLCMLLSRNNFHKMQNFMWLFIKYLIR